MSDETVDYRVGIKRILKGSSISVGITAILLLIFSLLLAYTSLSENTIPVIIIIITGISILIGSGLSTLHIKKNGILNGMTIGLIYIIAIYLISSIISGNFSMNIYSIIMVIASIVTRSHRRHNWSKYEKINRLSVSRADDLFISCSKVDKV